MYYNLSKQRWGNPKPPKKKAELMAIYRAETKCITRSKNHNAVAAAAYRAGQKLTDTNEFNDDAKTYDYSKKGGVLSADIVLPKSLKAADFSIERQELWSHVEQHEVTKADNSLKENARVAREWLLALPHELSDDENRALALEFAQLLADELGVIADCCIHKPTPQTLEADVDVAEKDSNEQHSDPRNIHAHIMFTTRKAHLCDDNTLMFGDKADSELSGQARKKRGLIKETDYLKKVREVWADMVNERLAKHDINLVDHRSYSDRHLDIKPQVHLGSYLSKLEASGEETQRGNYNRDIIQRNELVFTRRADILNSLASRADGESAKTEQYLRSGDSAAQWTADQARAVSKRLEYGKHQVIEISQAIKRRNIILSNRVNHFDDSERRARASKLTEQQRQSDQRTREINEDIARNRYADESAAKSFGKLRIMLAIKLLSRYHKSNALQDDEDVLQWPQKFDKRQIQDLDRFSDIIGVNTKTNDFREESKRIAELFTSEIINKYTNIIQILKDASVERSLYGSKSSEYELQDVSSSIDTHKGGSLRKAPDKLTESLSTNHKRYRP